MRWYGTVLRLPGMAVALLLACLVGSGFGGDIPAGWISIDSGAFTFMGPADMQYIPLQGLGSFVGRYQSASIDLGFDYGSSTYDLSAMTDDSIAQIVRIDGQVAKVVTNTRPMAEASKGFYVAVYFPTLRGNNTLTIEARCVSREAQQNAARLFESIRFPGK